MSKKQQGDWEKEFDNKFIPMDKEDLEQNNFIKDFISTQIHQARAEGYSEGLNLRKEYNDPELIKKIENQIYQDGYKAGYTEALKPKIKMIDSETAKALAGGEFEDILKKRDEMVRAETLKEVEQIMRDTLSADTLEYHNEVIEMYKKLDKLKQKK